MWLLNNITSVTVGVPTGSPFQYSVGQLSLGGSHKVQVGGPGLEKGEVGIRSKCTLYTYVL